MLLYSWLDSMFRRKAARGHSSRASQAKQQRMALAALIEPLEARQLMAADGLQIKLIPAPGTPRAVINGFHEAAAIWSGLLHDSVTVNFTIGFAPLDDGTLGGALPDLFAVSYADFRSSLNDDVTTAGDRLAVASLQAGVAPNFLINHTTNSPNGSNSAAPYLDNDGDNNNRTTLMSTANAKRRPVRAVT